MAKLTLRAKWLLPGGGPPLENARLTIEAGQIAAVEPARGGQGRADVDYGDAVILPGLINAHTHLELTHLRGEVPPGRSLADWIVTLSGRHPRRTGDELAVRASIRSGIAQSLAAGVTTVADISAGPVAIDAWSATPIRMIGFLEVLGTGPRRFIAADQQIALLELCASGPPVSDQRAAVIPPVLGISPHAPYSTDAPVYRAAIDYARRSGCPLTTHLAETREEDQFLRDGMGPFRELLEQFGVWDGSFESPGCSPVEYAQRIGLLERRPLLAHVNYASDADLDILACSGASVALCPRSHAFFGHEPHRYGDMVARGINVCLGTDSLASSDTLSILDEIRFLRRTGSPLPDHVLLQMATVNGARALGMEPVVGSLAPGLSADLIVLPLTNPKTRDPSADILNGDVNPSAVFVCGSAALG